jgi:hypothetical protein
VLIWYCQRDEHSENGIKELKIGFDMERIPCGQESANDAFFRIGAIAQTCLSCSSFKHSTLGEGWQRHRIVYYTFSPCRCNARNDHYVGALTREGGIRQIGAAPA